MSRNDDETSRSGYNAPRHLWSAALTSPSHKSDSSTLPKDANSWLASRHPHLRQLAVQLAAFLAVLTLVWPYYSLRNEQIPWPEAAIATGALALLLATLSRQPWWWRVIHAVFAPLAWAVAELAIDPGWFLLLTFLLLLVYRGALSGQVPLYLSNPDTAAALAELTEDRPQMRFLDLGAGVGSILRPLAIARPDATFTGIENAPATWLAGRLYTAALANCSWRWGNLWHTRLAEFDVVYAFLSPAPMPDLWEKVKNEMRPGSLFISNSFAIPGIEASAIFEVSDHRQTRLYCYQR